MLMKVIIIIIMILLYPIIIAISKGYFYKINTPQFTLANRSQYGNGCDFKQKNIEHRGNNCFIPTKLYCFVKGINFITGQVFRKQYL